MATINEVSELAKVSISTVSRVINNNAPVKESTRKRVYLAMEQLGYQPNLFAQGLVTNRSRSITLVLTDSTGGYFGPLVKGIENTLREAKYNLSVSVGNEGLPEVQDTFRYLISWRSDAVILFPHCLTDEQILALKETAPPMVVLNRQLPELSQQSIMVDNEQGSRLAIQHFLDNGHQQIACIAGPLGNSEALSRLEGYRAALNENEIVHQDNQVVVSDFTVEGGYEAIGQLLEQGTEFSAIYACNDQMAVGAMKALKDAGKRIPEDVSVIGFDDVEFAGLITPSLTTIRQPIAQMAEDAAKLAVRLIEGKTNLPVQPLYSPTLIERESVAPFKG